MPSILINGVVSARNMQPYVQILTENGMIGQFTMAEARSIAMDILVMCSRTEADAMIVKFFGEKEFPQGACAALLNDFREFRSAQDAAHVERFEEKGENDSDA